MLAILLGGFQIFFTYFLIFIETFISRRGVLKSHFFPVGGADWLEIKL